MPIERMLLMDKEGRRCTLEKTPKSLGFKLDLLNVLELLETPSSNELADVISIKWQMNGKKPIITKANIVIFKVHLYSWSTIWFLENSILCFEGETL